MVHESGGDSFEGCGVGDDCIACVVEEGYRDKNRNRFKIKGAYGFVALVVIGVIIYLNKRNG